MEGVCLNARRFVHGPSVRREVRLRAPALRVKYIDWHVSCASLSNPNRMNTLAFPIYDGIAYSMYSVIQLLQPFRQAGFAVLPSVRIINHGIACLCETHRPPNAATVTPQPMEKLQCALASIGLTVAYTMCSKARSLTWSWVVICKNTLYFGFEVFDTSITHAFQGMWKRNRHLVRDQEQSGTRDTSGHVEQ